MSGIISGSVALVTGGSRGIGRSISLALASRGVKVAVNYVADESAAEQVLGEIRAAGGEGGTFRADVANEVDVQKMLGRIESGLGPGRFASYQRRHCRSHAPY